MDIVAELARGRAAEPVWHNKVGGTTWRLAGGAEFVKVGRAHPEFDPRAEARRLEWLAATNRPGVGLAVPTVLGHGGAHGLRWFHTRGLPGTTAIALTDDPAATVRALGAGLRRFHDALPTADCPFAWAAEDRLAGLPAETREALGGTPSLDAVVCHGDACNPNFLIDASGVVTGCVDLGGLGIADRWADIAAAVLSSGLNFGPRWGDLGWREVFLDGYGIALDEAKFDWYATLWDGE